MRHATIALLLSLTASSAIAQHRPLIIDHVGGQPLGRKLALALQSATNTLKQGAGHRVLLVTGPTPCQAGVVVSLTVTRGDTFLSSGVLFVAEADINATAAKIAEDLAQNLK